MLLEDLILGVNHAFRGQREHSNKALQSLQSKKQYLLIYISFNNHRQHLTYVILTLKIHETQVFFRTSAFSLIEKTEDGD